MVLAWENLQRSFCDVGLVFYLEGGFSFHCFSTSSLTLPWAITRFLDPFYTFSPAHRRVIHDTFILTFHFYRQCYGFEWAFFTHDFALHSFVCDSDGGRNTPFRILLCSCLHRVVPSGWCMDLNYWCLNYKTIDLSIAQVSHQV